MFNVNMVNDDNVKWVEATRRLREAWAVDQGDAPMPPMLIAVKGGQARAVARGSKRSNPLLVMAAARIVGLAHDADLIVAALEWGTGPRDNPTSRCMSCLFLRPGDSPMITMDMFTVESDHVRWKNSSSPSGKDATRAAMMLVKLEKDGMMDDVAPWDDEEDRVDISETGFVYL